jgi:pilus assembly protein FimV
MIRKLVFALSLLGACFTGLVHALGLGEATVKSSLNQPLTAEIELVSIGELGIDEILPGLATREEFLKAKVDRVYFLSDLRFEVIENEKGNLAVVLTTTKPVREPFLNFLVEVIWPSGRLLREYALLIDPPLFSKEKASTVQAPIASQRIIDSNATTDQLSSGDQLSVSGPTKTSVAAVNSGNQTAGTYGATTANDTLWEIAVKARPNRSVTPQQVMLSIQDLNPKAFIDQNINKLKAGQVLRLPTLEQVKERNSNQAIIEVIAQNEAIRPKRTRSVASTAKQSTPKASQNSGSSADELKLVVSSKQANTSNTANSGSSLQAGNGRAESNEEMMLALEKLDKANLENSELNGKVTDLEEQLQTLQRILALKNDQLANIQGQMRANELASVDETADVALQDNAAQSAVEEPVLAKIESADAEPIVADKIKVEPKEEVKKVVEVASKPEVKKSAPEKNQNIVEMIIGNPLYLGLLVVGVIVLLVVLWLVSRNNALKEEEYYSQNADDEQDEDLFETNDAESQEFDEDQGQDELNELTSVDESEELDNDFALDHEDNDSQEEERESEDVIAEADVYIAYGRLDQAANILEKAISAEPVRTDYRLKLLEVYKDSNDSESFNRQFSELEAIQDESAIEEATQIRTELLENELVSLEDKEQELAESRQIEEALETRQDHSAELDVEAEALENDTKSFDFDSVDETSDAGLDVDFSSDELELDLDVDLDLAEEDELLTAEVDDLEFDAADLELEADDLELQADDLGDTTVLQEIESDSLSGDELAEPLSENAALLDIDLDDVDLSGELDQETEIELSNDLSTELELSENLDENVSDEILDEAVDAFSGNDELVDGLGDTDDFDFLDGTDEASTKLDLARAYIDMGDVDGAKDILGEVAKEGSDAQKAEANELLGSL